MPYIQLNCIHFANFSYHILYNSSSFSFKVEPGLDEPVVTLMDQVCQATNQVENDSEKLTLDLKLTITDIVFGVIFMIVIIAIIAKIVGRP